MKIKLLLCVVLIGGAMMFSSCSKELEGDELDYVGTWEGDYTTINIQANGDGSYEYYDGFLSKTASGKVRVKGDNLRIGIKKLSIDEKPHEDSYGWTMTLDGEEFERW